MIAAVSRVFPGRRAGTRLRITPAVWLGLGTIYLLWGSTYLGIRLSLDGFPALLMGAIRFSLAGLLLLGWAVWRGDWRAERLSRSQWLATIAVGAALFLGGNGGVILAEQYVPTGVTALCVATAPLWMAILDRILYGQHLNRLGILGLIIGFGGVVILVGLPGTDRLDWRGLALALAAPLCWATGSVTSRHAALPRRPVVGNGIELLSSGVLLGLASMAVSEPARWNPATVPPHAIAAIVYLVIFGSIVGFTTYAWLLRNAPLSLVSTYAYVNPVVAVSLGAIILHEALTLRTLLAGVVIVAGVVLILTARLRAASPAPRAEPARP